MWDRNLHHERERAQGYQAETGGVKDQCLGLRTALYPPRSRGKRDHFPGTHLGALYYNSAEEIERFCSSLVQLA